jgi:hypothetical protein
MNCPPEIAKIITEILTAGLLRIRALGWSGANTERCAVEADHLHNLPALLNDFKPELLAYYWDAERVSFIERSSPEEVEGFEPLWDAMSGFVPRSEKIVATLRGFSHPSGRKD